MRTSRRELLACLLAAFGLRIKLKETLWLSCWGWMKVDHIQGLGLVYHKGVVKAYADGELWKPTPKPSRVLHRGWDGVWR